MQLDLHVASTQVFESPIAIPPGGVAGAVHTRTRIAGGVGNETRCGQPCSAEVSARELCPGHVHLPDDAGRNRIEAGVENGDTQRRDRLADDAGRSGRRELLGQSQVAHVDRRLGDAVHVDQGRRCLLVPCVPATELPEIECFSTEDDVPQRQCVRSVGGSTGRGCHTIGFGELVERRRRLVENRDLLANQQLAEQFRRACGVVVDDHESAAVQQWSPQFPHREVERVGVEHGPHVAVVEVEQIRGVREQRRHVTVRDLHTLGTSGTTRGVDDVGDRIGIGGADAVGVGQRGSGHACQLGDRFGCIEQQHLDIGSRHRCTVGDGGDHTDR
ncbi:unannotated protein [freshwater metagenome]|uniref:Unannotated protein n=1 Tax=freshwater metagenome TaxID=449393 RepID=A0A6J7F8M5_9ZZZZ